MISKLISCTSLPKHKKRLAMNKPPQVLLLATLNEMDSNISYGPKIRFCYHNINI